MNGSPAAASSGFLERVSRVLREEFLVGNGETVLIACSGGVDSMVLLDIMDRLGRRDGFSIAAAHLDHSLRGPEGRKDQELVARFCRERGIPFMGGKEDVRGFSGEKGLSLQDGARRVRYAFLDESLRKIRGHKIATAHHADDQVETVLMRLLRGTGPGGLRGIPVKRCGVYIRPLLSEWKVDIEAYADVRRIPFREDPGNRESKYQRNRIRNVLLPSLETYNPRIKESLLRLSRLIAEEGEALDLFIDETLKRVEFKKTGEEITVNRKILLGYHPFVIKEIVRRAIRELRAVYGPDSRNLDLALNFIRGATSGKRMNLPSGMEIGRDFDEIFIRVVRKQNPEGCRCESVLDIRIEHGWREKYDGGGQVWTVQVDVLAKGKKVGPAVDSSCQCFDRERIEPPLRLRKWRPGDTIEPAGMKGRKKVSDLLTEEKIARRRRNGIVLIEDAKSVLWVVGVRRSRRATVSGETGEIIYVSVRPDPAVVGRKM